MANKDEQQSAINHLAQAFADSIKEITVKLDGISKEIHSLKNAHGEGSAKIEKIELELESLREELVVDDESESFASLTEAVSMLKSGTDSEEEDEEDDEPAKKVYKKKRR